MVGTGSTLGDHALAAGEVGQPPAPRRPGNPSRARRPEWARPCPLARLHLNLGYLASHGPHGVGPVSPPPPRGPARITRLGLGGPGRLATPGTPTASRNSSRSCRRQTIVGSRLSTRGPRTGLPDEPAAREAKRWAHGVWRRQPHDAARRMIRRVEGEFNGGLARRPVIADLPRLLVAARHHAPR